jgi:hypothetical protein
MMRGGAVVVDARLGAGMDMDGGLVQARDAVHQLMVALVGDGVGLDNA